MEALRAANYNFEDFLARVGSLLDRDSKLLGTACQRTVIRREKDRNQNALTLVVIQPAGEPPCEAKLSDYGEFLLIQESIDLVELRRRLQMLEKCTFHAGEMPMELVPPLNFTDEFTPSFNTFSQWPGRLFQVQGNRVNMASGTSLGKNLKPYKDSYAAIQEFLSIRPFHRDSDGRLGAVLLFIPSMWARIEKLHLDPADVVVEVSNVLPPKEVSLNLIASAGEQTAAINLEPSSTTRFPIAFVPNEMELWLVSEKLGTLDYYRETPYYSIGDQRDPVLPRQSKPEEVLDLRSQLKEARTQLDLFRNSAMVARPIWEGRGFPMEPDYCFVLMPLGEVHDLPKVFHDHIKPVIEKRCSLRCERANDINNINGIMQSVWESINRARVIIADLTDKNPNVFYELGIAHTLGKPVVMITQSMDHVPFDLRHLRCIEYAYKPDRIKQFEETLAKTVLRVLSSDASPLLQLNQD